MPEYTAQKKNETPKEKQQVDGLWLEIIYDPLLDTLESPGPMSINILAKLPLNKIRAT